MSLRQISKSLNVRGLATAATATVQKTAADDRHFLTDKFGRDHSYLRISLTEKCNLRCTYCMPAEGVPLKPNDKMLTTPEITKLSELFMRHGMRKVRLTGGEPTLRKDLKDIIGSIAALPNCESVAMTTNGLTLHRNIADLVDVGLKKVNISLDTLLPDKFELMTRRPAAGLKKVHKTINLASELLPMVKLNAVVMRNINDDEVVDFIRLTEKQNIDVRFIEFMPFGGNSFQTKRMVPYKELLARIDKVWPGQTIKLTDDPNDTTKAYKIDGYRGQFGFITSMSEHFCGTCNRLRITADGNLKVCLHGNAEVSLRDALRSGATEEELIDMIGEAVGRKKKAHAGMENLAKMPNRPMILIENFSNLTVDTLLEPNPSESKSTGDQNIEFQLPKSHINTIIESSFQNSNFQNPLFTRNSNSNLMFQSRHFCSSPDSPSSLPENDVHLTHVDKKGQARMVNVGEKVPSNRTARAECDVLVQQHVADLLRDNAHNKKGNALMVAQLAGVMAAKRTHHLIPLCHSVSLSNIQVQLELLELRVEEDYGQIADDRCMTHRVRIQSEAQCSEQQTGVEMEALTAVSVAALTVYDMCKAASKSMLITNCRLISKSGGKSGDFQAE